MKDRLNNSLILTTVTSIVFMTFGASSVSSFQAHQSFEENAQLLIQIEGEALDASGSLILILSIKNNTREILYLDVTYPERDYKFEVKNVNGTTVPLTEVGERLVNNTAIYLHGSLKIEPNKEVRHRVAINKLYDMVVPGSYSIVVSRKVLGPDFEPFTTVISNSIKVKL